MMTRLTRSSYHGRLGHNSTTTTYSMHEHGEMHLAWAVSRSASMTRGRTKSFFKQVEHKRCNQCAELKKRLRTEQSKDELMLIQQVYDDHINRNNSDRAIDARLEHLSELSTMLSCALAHRSLMLRIDGLDQAKTKRPRNLEDSKTWASLWRPQMHCIVVLIEGVLEA